MHHYIKQSSLALVIAGLLAAWSAPAAERTAKDVDISKLPPPSTRKNVTYAQDIRPLLETSCLRCHGENRPKAALRLDSLEGALKGSEHGKVITPGKSQESLLVIAVAQIDEESAMPPKRRPRGPGAPGQPRPVANPPAGGAPGGPGRPGGPGGNGGPGGGGFGPPPPPLTAEQVGLVRAWIDQGAK